MTSPPRRGAGSRPRLVYLSQSVIPSRTANSIQVMRMCEAFAAHGFDVTLLAPRSGPRATTGTPFEYYGVAPTFRLRYLPWVPVPGRKYLYAALAALSVRRHRADVVYARCLFSTVATIVSTRRPVMYEAHGHPLKGRHRWFNERVLFGRRGLHRLVTISHALAEQFAVSERVDRRRILVAPDAAAAPDRNEAVELGDDLLNVVYTGHLYQGRGIELIEDLARRCPWARFHLVGGNEDDLATWSTRLAPAGNVVLHGHVAPARVAAFTTAADVLLAPYQRTVAVAGNAGDTVRWMSPLKIFEYLAAGVAIVCSDLPVLREVLEHGETALLCDPEDADAWEAALHDLHQHPARRRALGERALQAFEANHSWERRAARIAESFRTPR